MNRVEWEYHKSDFVLKTLVQQEQFAQWLRHFFLLSVELENEYDTIYQELFYVKFYELLGEGVEYATRVSGVVTNSPNQKKDKWYARLLKGLDEMKSMLAEVEVNYIEYRRHIACHIFQNSYEVIQESLKIKRIRKEKDLDQLRDSFAALILEHGSDKSIDEYLNKKLRPYIAQLYIDLSDIHNEKTDV